MHVLVPGNWTVKRGHKLVTQIENEIYSALPDSQLFTHLEALSDPDAMDDVNFGNSAGK
jgi:divalent metal cation (Fe/Co/Zn/Cd) transporter